MLEVLLAALATPQVTPQESPQVTPQESPQVLRLLQLLIEDMPTRQMLLALGLKRPQIVPGTVSSPDYS